MQRKGTEVCMLQGVVEGGGLNLAVNAEASGLQVTACETGWFQSCLFLLFISSRWFLKIINRNS